MTAKPADAETLKELKNETQIAAWERTPQGFNLPMSVHGADKMVTNLKRLMLPHTITPEHILTISDEVAEDLAWGVEPTLPPDELCIELSDRTGISWRIARDSNDMPLLVNSPLLRSREILELEDRCRALNVDLQLAPHTNYGDVALTFNEAERLVEGIKYEQRVHASQQRFL